MNWKSFKVGVRNNSGGPWVYNALRFHTEENAQAYADDLMLRWTWVREASVHLSEDEPNAVFPVPDATYHVPQADRLNYVPRATDIKWAREMIRTIQEGGMLIYPSTELIYTMHHSERTLILQNPEKLILVESLIVHMRTVATFGEIRWRVIVKEEMS